MEKTGKGYDGYSMSNNAREAYENESMPMSKWTKADLVYGICEINENLSEGLVQKLTAKTLKNQFLESDGWHHTSMLYNKTDFYKLNEEKIEETTDDDLVSFQIERNKKTEEEKAEIKKQKELKKNQTEEKKEFLKLMEFAPYKYATQKAFLNDCKNPEFVQKLKEIRDSAYLSVVSSQKTFRGFCKAFYDETLNLEKLNKKLQEKITIRREELRKSWIAQNYESGLNQINDDEFICKYL